MVGWVFHQEIKSAPRKLVLLALADFAGQDGTTWATIETLCVKTSLNRKTVISAISELEKAGYLYDTTDRKGTTRSIKVYQLIIDGHEETTLNKQYRKRNGTENGTVPFLHGSSTENGQEAVPFLRQSSTKNGPQTVIEPPIEPIDDRQGTGDTPVQRGAPSQSSSLEVIKKKVEDLKGSAYVRAVLNEKPQWQSHLERVFEVANRRELEAKGRPIGSISGWKARVLSNWLNEDGTPEDESELKKSPEKSQPLQNQELEKSRQQWLANKSKQAKLPSSLPEVAA